MSEANTSHSGAGFRILSLAALRECPLNPRRHWNPALESTEIGQLADSIRAVGIIEPLVVRPQDGHFEIIAGSRRFRAAKLAELTDVPTMVRELSDEQALEILITENNQRADITPLEEAGGYRRLLDMGYSLDRLAERIGRSRKYIWDRMKLLDLVPEAQELLEAQRITAGHAILLARLKPEQQKGIVNPEEGALFKHETGTLTWNEDDEKREGEVDPYAGMKAVSVRELEGHIAEHVRFDPKTAAAAAPLDFGPIAARVDQAAAQPGRGKKVIPITHDSYVHPDAKPENHERTYCCSSWKRADGSDKDSPSCDRAVLGVVVVGPEYGQAFEVCVNKDCDVHWKEERQDRERQQKHAGKNGSSGRDDSYKEQQERWRKQHEREEAERNAWVKAIPALLQALAVKVKTAKLPDLAGLVLKACNDYTGAALRSAKAAFSAGKTADDILRLAALTVLSAEAHEYNGQQKLPKLAQPLGVDVAAILKAQAKPEKTKAGTCRKCGCTDDHACKHGCAWVDATKTLCSSCAPKTKSAGTKAAKLATPPKNEARPLGATKPGRKAQTSAVKKGKKPAKA